MDDSNTTENAFGAENMSTGSCRSRLATTGSFRQLIGAVPITVVAGVPVCIAELVMAVAFVAVLCLQLRGRTRLLEHDFEFPRHQPLSNERSAESFGDLEYQLDVEEGGG